MIVSSSGENEKPLETGATPGLARLIHQRFVRGWRVWRKPLMWRRIRLLTPNSPQASGSHTRHDQRYDSAVLVSSCFPQEDHSSVRRWATDLRWGRHAVGDGGSACRGGGEVVLCLP